MNPETLFSRISEIAAEPGSRLDQLQKIASVLREEAGYRWVGFYDVDIGKREVRNLVWDGPSAPKYPTFPITGVRLRSHPSQGESAEEIPSLKNIN